MIYQALVELADARDDTHVRVQQMLSESAAASLPDHIFQEVAHSISYLLCFVDLLGQYVNW